MEKLEQMDVAKILKTFDIQTPPTKNQFQDAVQPQTTAQQIQLREFDKLLNQMKTTIQQYNTRNKQQNNTIQMEKIKQNINHYFNQIPKKRAEFQKTPMDMDMEVERKKRLNQMDQIQTTLGKIIGRS